MRLCHPPDGSTSPKYKLLCLYHLNLFYQIQAALAFNRDMCCYLVLCLQLLPFHCKSSSMFIRPPHNPSANLFVCPSVYVSVRPSLCLSVSYVNEPVCLFAFSSKCAAICPSVCLSFCQSIHLSLYGSPCTSIQGILKGEVSLYCWPPVWLVWNQLYDQRGPRTHPEEMLVTTVTSIYNW